jgi:antirestriction protein
MARKKKDTPRIYVASLSDYNAGRLHGRWIDATDADDIREEIQAMLAKSPDPYAEEWAIHDYENFAGVSLGEYEDLDLVAEAAQLLEEHGELAGHVIGHFGGLTELDEAKTALTENYAGSADSLEDWAAELLDGTGELESLPEHLRGYFDYEAYARDIELSGDIFTVEVDGTVHVFWSR